MNQLHVRQRLEAFAARLRRAAGPGDRTERDAQSVHSDPLGMRTMDSFRAGRR